MLLTKYGTREWMIITLAAAAPAAAGVFFGWWWLVALAVVVWAALASFFRDPLFRKPATDDPRDMVSPADGLVSAVLEVPEHVATGGGPATIVRIYLSVFDVHINRMPCAAEVLGTVHTPGKYLDVRIEESAKVNESMVTRLRTAGGVLLGVKQISGKVARHIVCPVAAGQKFARGERYGMIKFGSTTELVVPTADVEKVCVAKGDRVTGGVTVLARLTRS